MYFYCLLNNALFNYFLTKDFAVFFNKQFAAARLKTGIPAPEQISVQDFAFRRIFFYFFTIFLNFKV